MHEMLANIPLCSCLLMAVRASTRPHHLVHDKASLQGVARSLEVDTSESFVTAAQ